MRIASSEVGDLRLLIVDRGMQHALDEGMQGLLHRHDPFGHHLLNHLDTLQRSITARTLPSWSQREEQGNDEPLIWDCHRCGIMLAGLGC
jgi:hypothetical protein